MRSRDSMEQQAEESAPVHMLGAEQEHVIVIGDNAINQAIGIKPGALSLSLAGRDDVGQPKQLQQLLAVPVHVRSRRLIRTSRPLVGRPQRLQPQLM